MPASSIGPFEIISSLGAGPRGSVYRAQRVDHGRIVAIKQLSAGLTQDSPEFTRLWNEVARLRAVVSNHVATTYSVELVEGRPVIEMESLGESLEKATNNHPLGLREALYAVRDILAGLKVLHDAGIGHGNLKPSNVLQDTTTGSWKLSDGGTTAIETQTTPTLLATSVLYAAPEMLLEQAGSNERSDLYSVGMMGLEAVLGGEGLGTAFPQVSNLQSPSRWLTWLEDSTQEARPLHEVRPDTPERVSNFFCRLLAKDAGGRFPSAFAATVELEAILLQLPSTTSEMPTYSGVTDTPTLLVRPPEGSKACLRIAGPKEFDQQLELSDRTYRIGRDAQNDIVLPDETKAVSRIHAELTRDGERYLLTDLDSQNGLWVSGRRKPTVQLQPGVPVKIGGYTITFSPAAVAAENSQKPAKSATGKPAPAAKSAQAKTTATPAQTGAAKLALNGVTAVASRFGGTVRAFWPPKNAQQWAAVGSAAAVLVTGVLWLALRNPKPPDPGPVDTSAGSVMTPAPPVTPVPTAPEESVQKVRELIRNADYQGALKDADTLLTLYPEDKNVQALKQEAADGLAKQPPPPPTPQATANNAPPKAPGPRRGGPPPANTGVASNQPPIPKRATESDAEWRERYARYERDAQRAQEAAQRDDFKAALRIWVSIDEPAFPNLAENTGRARAGLNRQVQAAIKEGQNLVNKDDLPGGLKAFERARELDPSSADAKSAYDGLRARMTQEGEQAFKEGRDDVNYRPNEAKVKLNKALLYLPDGHPMKKEAKDILDKIGRQLK